MNTNRVSAPPINFLVAGTKTLGSSGPCFYDQNKKEKIDKVLIIKKE